MLDNTNAHGHVRLNQNLDFIETMLEKLTEIEDFNGTNVFEKEAEF